MNHPKKYLSLSQRSLVTGLKDIAEMTEKLNTTRPVMESGQLTFEKIQTKRALKGRSNDSIAACLYFACRKNNVPRTFKEVCAVAKSSKKGITRCYKAISKVIGEVPTQSSVVHYIPRFSEHLELPEAVENRVRHLVERFEEVRILAARSPSTVTALAIVMAIDGLKWNPKGKTGQLFASDYAIKQIAEVTGASVSAIRDAQKVVKAQGGKEFAECFYTEQTFQQKPTVNLEAHSGQVEQLLTKTPHTRITTIPTGSMKHKCKLTGCGKTFFHTQDLVRHERFHLGVKSYSCTWQDCKHSSEHRYSVVRHIRVVYFKLPKSVKKQIELNHR